MDNQLSSKMIRGLASDILVVTGHKYTKQQYNNNERLTQGNDVTKVITSIYGKTGIIVMDIIVNHNKYNVPHNIKYAVILTFIKNK